jgi:hypothetical protein
VELVLRVEERVGRAVSHSCRTLREWAVVGVTSGGGSIVVKTIRRDTEEEIDLVGVGAAEVTREEEIAERGV